MNSTFNFKAANFNAADLFGTTTAIATGRAPVPGVAAATDAGAAVPVAMPPALPGIAPAPARPLFADAMGNSVRAGKPGTGTVSNTEESDQAPTDGMPVLPQETPLPSMAAPWIAAPVQPAASPVRDSSGGGNDMPVARAVVVAADIPPAPVEALPASTVAATTVAALPAAATIATAPAVTTPVTTATLSNMAPAAATQEAGSAVSQQVAVAATPHDTATRASMNLFVRPAALQFNAQLGGLVTAPQLGEPLAAAMPSSTGETTTAAPAVRSKIVQGAVETLVDAVPPAASATLPPVIMPAAAAAFVSGVMPEAAVPASAETVTSATSAVAAALAPVMPVTTGVATPPAQPARPDATATAFEPAAAAVPPARAASNTVVAEAAVDASSPARPYQGLADAPAMQPKASTVGKPDTERNVASATATTPPPAASLGLAPAVTAGMLPAQGGDIIKLNGTAQQWQEPLREALGERLQTQIGRNSEHAVIRLDPPMLGRIDISIRHTAGMLQVNLSASNTEVLRQLQGISENMRNDLAQRQYTEVAVNISATPRSPAAQAFAEGDARGQRQPGRQQDDAEPGRALSDGTPAGAPYGATFAMHEREYN